MYEIFELRVLPEIMDMLQLNEKLKKNNLEAICL
jgi:hypothetical protein